MFVVAAAIFFQENHDPTSWVMGFARVASLTVQRRSAALTPLPQAGDLSTGVVPGPHGMHPCMTATRTVRGRGSGQWVKTLGDSWPSMTNTKV